MPYVTLGAAHVSDDDVSENGISYGIGAEYRKTEKFNLGLDYSTTTFTDVVNIDGLDIDVDLIQIRGSYRFQSVRYDQKNDHRAFYNFLWFYMYFGAPNMNRFTC